MVKDRADATLAIVSSEGSSFRRITIQELNDLGYELTGRQLPMGSKKPECYTIQEVKHEGSKADLSFCYIYSLREQTGVIMPNSYNTSVNRYCNR